MNHVKIVYYICQQTSKRPVNQIAQLVFSSLTNRSERAGKHLSQGICERSLFGIILQVGQPIIAGYVVMLLQQTSRLRSNETRVASFASN